MKTVEYWIKKLDLKKHPEGGWFREIYRSEERVMEQSLPDNFKGERNIATSIYYLLAGDDISSFHRIKSDEIWHYYKGNSAIEIVSIQEGRIVIYAVGDDADANQRFQVVVPKNTWFAARLSNPKGFALAGCTVSPGFHFEDFEMASESLLKEYPNLEKEIRPLLK